MIFNMRIALLAFLFISSVAFALPEDLMLSKNKEEGLVVKVTDSDMLVLENGQRIQLIGVESAGAPPRKYLERDKNGMLIEEKEAFIPLEEQAVTYAQNLLEGKKVKLEYDVEALNREGYKQAYVFLPDGHLANVELLRQGFVKLKIRPPNVKYAEQMRNAYQEAKREQRGFLSN
jgi:micrococcal nuclease